MLAAVMELAATGSLLGMPGDLKACAAVWDRQLPQDLPDGAVLAAVAVHLKDREAARRWPTVADLLGYVEAIGDHAAGRPREVSADEVWPVVLGSLQGVHDFASWDEQGNYRPVPAHQRFQVALSRKLGAELADRAIVALGGPSGYRALCVLERDQMAPERLAFRRAWESGERREREAQVLRPMFGAASSARAVVDQARAKPAAPPLDRSR